MFLRLCTLSKHLSVHMGRRKWKVKLMAVSRFGFFCCCWGFFSAICRRLVFKIPTESTHHPGAYTRAQHFACSNDGGRAARRGASSAGWQRSGAGHPSPDGNGRRAAPEASLPGSQAGGTAALFWKGTGARPSPGLATAGCWMLPAGFQQLPSKLQTAGSTRRLREGCRRQTWAPETAPGMADEQMDAVPLRGGPPAGKLPEVSGCLSRCCRWPLNSVRPREATAAGRAAWEALKPALITSFWGEHKGANRTFRQLGASCEETQTAAPRPSCGSLPATGRRASSLSRFTTAAHGQGCRRCGSRKAGFGTATRWPGSHVQRSGSWVFLGRRGGLPAGLRSRPPADGAGKGWHTAGCPRQKNNLHIFWIWTFGLIGLVFCTGGRERTDPSGALWNRHFNIAI